MWRLLSVLGLTVLVSSCVPFAGLRAPDPVKGSSTTIGASVLTDFKTFIPMPQLSYAFGDGNTEFNLSTQIGLAWRLGLKQRLGDKFSGDFGITPFFLGNVFSLAADAGVIIGFDEFYVSPRVLWVGAGATSSGSGSNTGIGASGFMGQAGFGYAGSQIIAEANATLPFSSGGGFILTFSLGLRL